MKQRLVLAIILLVSALQLRAQGIVVNLKDGTNVKFSSESVENITTYGYDGSPHTGYVNGHEYVDLGLPSGTLWATCNVGASKPEAYGEYYAWGETKTKASYNWETYQFGRSYSTLQDIGKDIAGTKYDVAHVKWGVGWRMPTKEQIQELKDNTINTKIIQNGVEGYIYKSKIYSNCTIFLPSVGSYWHSELKDDFTGDYWTSEKENGYLQSVAFYESGSWTSRPPCEGKGIRPVSIK